MTTAAVAEWALAHRALVHAARAAYEVSAADRAHAAGVAERAS